MHAELAVLYKKRQSSSYEYNKVTFIPAQRMRTCKCLEKFSMKDKFRVRAYSESDVQGSFVQTGLGTNVVFRVFSALYL